MKGIYQYKDLKTADVVYIGKDSHIDKSQRHKDHLNSSKYNEQPFNRALQNNPNRYKYSVIWITEDCTTLKLNKMEILFGKIYNPKFNFDKFGKGGCTGHSEETKQKISESHIGKTLSDETKEKISESLTGITRSDETKEKISESMPLTKNTSGYFHVTKKKCKRCNQAFTWCYRYFDNDGKEKHICSIELKKLEKKVKAKGLRWKKLK